MKRAERTRIMRGIWQHTLWCPHCGAVVKLAPTNANARLNATCEGQEEVATFTNGQRDPVIGSHPSTEMRQIGGRWL